MNTKSESKQESYETKRNQVKVYEQRGTESKWVPISEEEWSRIQTQHWESLSRWLSNKN